MIIRTLTVGVDVEAEEEIHTVNDVTIGITGNWTLVKSTLFPNAVNLIIANGSSETTLLLPYDYAWVVNQVVHLGSETYLDLAYNHELDREYQAEHKVMFERIMSSLNRKDHNEISQPTARTN